MAPSFPDAADIPWHVDLYLVGNNSPGIIKVVELGPKFVKKFAKMNRQINPKRKFFKIESKNMPNIKYIIVRAVNPINYIYLLPQLSI